MKHVIAPSRRIRRRRVGGHCVGAGAKGPQIRETVTVQGVLGGSAQEHHLTFSGPVALPGVALAPGTYIFSRPAGNILRVTDARRQPVRDAQHRLCVADIAEQSLRSSSRRTTDRWLATPRRGVVRARRIERPAADPPESATLTPDTVVSGR